MKKKFLAGFIIAISVILFSVTFVASGQVVSFSDDWPVGGGAGSAYWLISGATPRSVEFTPNPAGTFRVLWVSVRFDESGTTENFVMAINNASGSEYDTVVKDITMVGESNYFWMPDSEFIVVYPSGLSMYCTSNGAQNNINVTIQYESGVR